MVNTVYLMQYVLVRIILSFFLFLSIFTIYCVSLLTLLGFFFFLSSFCSVISGLYTGGQTDIYIFSSHFIGKPLAAFLSAWLWFSARLA